LATPELFLLICHQRFFVISGFLTATNLLRDAKRLQEIKVNDLSANARLYGKMLLSRYMRLTPVLLIVMLVSTFAASILNDASVYQLFFRDDLKCPQSVNLW
jgi:peptidoglycan/LPS O-acetylase OafA/YrhL